GSIDAQLVLRGDRLLVSVAAGASSSVDELAMARQQLVEALAAAGLTVESLRVDER
ncbi:MAG: flagellar hook-length control protein FliK, partial [Burkholderiales bacterium]|nr:flagellar hook-length control protein FliK [Burkholderiales bacterium]